MTFGGSSRVHKAFVLGGLIMKFLNIVMLASFLAFGLFSSTKASHAENMTWYVKSNYPYKVSVVFYSRTRRNHAWPGGTKVYVIANSRVKEYSLSCRRGEKICFGAWVRGRKSRYWGVGYRGRKGCKRCCYTCNGGETRTQILNP